MYAYICTRTVLSIYMNTCLFTRRALQNTCSVSLNPWSTQLQMVSVRVKRSSNTLEFLPEEGYLQETYETFFHKTPQTV